MNSTEKKKPFDCWGGTPFKVDKKLENGSVNLVINKNWFLEQYRGKPVGQPKYDPGLWQKIPDYAKDKMENIEEDLEGSILYPEIVETVANTYNSGEPLLDIGCAGGHFYKMLSYHVPGINYTGIDITQTYLKFARAKFPDGAWTQGDVRRLPFPDKSFDHVLCLFVLVHLDQEGCHQAILELTRVARKQVLLAGYFSLTRIFGHQESEKDRDFIYDVIDIKELLVRGWSLEISNTTADMQERRVLKLPVEVQLEDGQWTKLYADVPIFSYVRLVRR